MKNAKRQKRNDDKNGKYNRDHVYFDSSSDEEGLYEDDHVSIKSSSSEERGELGKEEDFISLPVELDTRSRQDRRREFRDNAKRKRTDDDEEDWESHICFPWMDLVRLKPMPKPLSAIKLLQCEVDCFIQYLEPTPIEVQLREYLVHRIRHAIQSRFPEAEVFVFGSFSTQLYLPNSDIDLVVNVPPLQSGMLRRLAKIIESEDICRDPHIIENASVPVVKFEDTMTKLKVDIILNSNSGLESAVTINSLIRKYPALRPLSLIVKHLLALRSLNEVYTGGLGGYAIVCLIVSFLQMHPKVASGAIDPMKNLGPLLLDFFQFYGLNFNLDETGIDVRGNGSYYDKSHIHSRTGSSVFSIRDPQDRSNDIGCKSYNASQVVRAFKYAYISMSQKAFDLEAELRHNNYESLDKKTLESPKRSSILCEALHISTDFIKHRQLMNEVWNEKRWKNQAAAKTFEFLTV
ncbi:hypothetical protein EDC96DRAFT_523167 [Choanephora cucurbitarum]|nr:hypothetical protein EDC96DRAFT_523167 [Choanephora cucurbitarum]